MHITTIILAAATAALTTASTIPSDARSAGPILGPNYNAHMQLIENMNASAAADNAPLITTRGGTQSQTGFNNGYYYTFWTDNQAYVIYTNGNGGQYKVDWSGNGDFVAGKGWNPGSWTSVYYQGSYGPNPSAGSYLALYGWTTNPLVEYYIVDNFAGYNPSTGASYKGSFTIDGSSYNIYTNTRYNAPSIQGTSTFQQFWSVRQNKRVGGTINVGAHFDAWRQKGMNLGQYNYQVVVVEGFSYSGTATITVNGRCSNC